MNVLDMDATELAKQIHERKITSLEATNAYIQHLNHINPKINCLVEDRFELARREAAAIDKQIEAGSIQGKLFGVPISVKECFHVEGMKTTSGIFPRKDKIEYEDAEAVSKLKEEGAVILGKTNTPSFCFCQETENKLYGRTNNPWNVKHTAGGSSGGEAALIAAGGAAVGLGADIGGSIRFPSHFNGVIGFKSGNGQVSAAGNYPEITIEEQDRMLGIGAMAKSVRDARLLNQIITKAEPEPKDLSDFRIVIPGKQPKIPLGQETEECLLKLSNGLSDSFPTSTEMPPCFEEAALIWQEAMSIDGGQGLIEKLSINSKVSPAKEFIREKMFRNSDVHPYLSWALIGAGLFKPSDKRIREIREKLLEGDKVMNDYFMNRVAILPVYHCTAPLHGGLYAEIFSIRKTFLKYMPYIAYANTWGLPSLTIPIAEDKHGLPIGVQLISNNGNEEALFKLGEWIEQRFRGYKRCTYYDAQ